MENKDTIQEDFLEGGLILDENTISENDFILGGNSDLSVKLETLIADNPKIFYNQAAQTRTRNGCTNYAAFGCISDLLGYNFTIEEILEIHLLAESKYGWNEASGNYLYKAVDCLRDYWNEKFKDKQLITFRVDLLSDEAKTLFEAGKTIMIGYQTTKEHAIDSQDGKLDSSSFASAEKIGGHAIRKNKNINIDNYFGLKKFNSYENDHLESYVKEGTYFRHGYVFLEKEDSIFKDLPKNHPFYKRVKSLKDRGFINGYDDGTIRINEKISRGEVFIVLDRICEVYDAKIKELEDRLQS